MQEKRSSGVGDTSLSPPGLGYGADRRNPNFFEALRRVSDHTRNEGAHQAQLDRARYLIQQLQKCCRIGSFQWPTRNNLDELSDRVFDLNLRIRKQLRVPLWKGYKAIDDHWHLKLWQTIEDLVERASRNTPPRPLEKYDQMLRLEGFTEMTKKFFGHYVEIVRGRHPCSVAWEQFDDLFGAARKGISRSLSLTSRLGEVGGGSKLIAYVVFLELFHDDSRWTKHHWIGATNLADWVSVDLQHERMLKKLNRFLIPSFAGKEMIDDVGRLLKRRAEQKCDARRAKDRERKSRKK